MTQQVHSDLLASSFTSKTLTGATITSPNITTPTISDPTITGTIIEDVHPITDAIDFEIDPGNGSVQTITLTANRIPRGTNFVNGEAVTLMINNGTGDYTITWTSTSFGGAGVVWVGGIAPTLDNTKYTVVQLWKVAGLTYGASIGAA